ncbi:hypothetical protein EST38_g12190 [Candolleomyces aberdarensis]|uniref:Uncharacterized protein n=1 Tax=Candolleomyces aberdarensis TaxID=2316362 RepID=A0A4Q2D329_9AGAR|nr:hypothetical protein EST38_g12190 [Candolleomyces aberdarensis]
MCLVPHSSMTTSYNEIEINLPGRPDYMPPVFIATNHPKMPSCLAGKAYVLKYKTDECSRTARSMKERELKIPQGKDAELKAIGFLKLEPGDIVFGRDTRHGAKPGNDVILAWANGKDLFSKEECNKLQSATDKAFGSMEERKKESVRFERLPNAKPVSGSKRCYTFGPSSEYGVDIVAPCSTLKCDKGSTELTEYAKTVKDILSAVSILAVKSLETGPSEVLDIIKGQTNVIGMPRIGYEGNWAFPAVQVNLAAANAWETGASLEGVMGAFGAPHGDDKDAEGCFSNLFAFPQLPPGYDPGRFFLLWLGVYITLDQWTTLNFSGRQAHGGTAPEAPPGVTPAPHAQRFNIVSYPKETMISGCANYTMAARPTDEPKKATSAHGKEVYRTAQITNSNDDITPPLLPNRACWFREGTAVLPNASLLQVVARFGLESIGHMVSQIASDKGFEIDEEKLMSSISCLDEKGNRLTASSTEYTPSYGHTRTVKARAEATRKFKELCTKTRGYYPNKLYRPREEKASEKETKPTTAKVPKKDKKVKTSTKVKTRSQSKSRTYARIG